MLHVRPASFDDALALEPRLRQADKAEIKANSGDDPLTSLLRGIKSSNETYAITDDAGLVLAVGGVTMVSEGVGAPWLLASNDLATHKRDFLKMGKPWMHALNKTYRVLTNFIDARNTVHIRWLKWLGFSFPEEAQPFGAEQRPFYRFERIKDV